MATTTIIRERPPPQARTPLLLAVYLITHTLQNPLGYQPYALVAFTSQDITLVLISVRGSADPKAEG